MLHLESIFLYLGQKVRTQSYDMWAPPCRCNGWFLYLKHFQIGILHFLQF
jgi:hypothetical protein